MQSAFGGHLEGAAFPLLMGAATFCFTLGALSIRVTDTDDLLPAPIEAALLGAAFAMAALPKRWAVFARAAIPMPTLFLYLSVFLGKDPPLPFAAAFAAAGVYAMLLTAFSAYIADRPRRLRLHARRSRAPRRSAATS
jgi:hypothetical protein